MNEATMEHVMWLMGPECKAIRMAKLHEVMNQHGSDLICACGVPHRPIQVNETQKYMNMLKEIHRSTNNDQANQNRS